jgi:hypothetical protein
MCRVVVEGLDPQGRPWRSVITYADLQRARLQARTIAEFGRRAELHRADDAGAYSCLEVHEPR